MTTTTSTTAPAAFDFSKLTAINNPEVAKKATNIGQSGSLSQQQFLKLLTTQMTHQDPSKPMEDGSFLTQMAQFGTVSGVQDLQKSFADFSSSITSGQALQAAGLVGHYVSAPATQGVLETDKPLGGTIHLSGSTQNLQVKIIDPKTGQLIQTMKLGSAAKGDVPFSWDGSNAQGKQANLGLYKIEASAMIDNVNTVLATDIASKVDSVNIGAGISGLTVNLAGNAGSVNFNKITQVL